MIELLLGVLVSSLIGSVHCVGMCGPFALLAIATDSSSLESNSIRRWRLMIAYHIGRLSTYIFLGVIVGLVGLAADRATHSMGFSNGVARVTGSLMLGLGFLRLVQWISVRHHRVEHSKWMMAWTRGVIAIRKGMRGYSPTASSYAWGLVSTLLPCGWLYVFVLAAGSLGTPTRAVLLMTAFWLGTLPLLSFVAWGVRAMGTRVQFLVQPGVACLLIFFGLYTATGRAQIDLTKVQAPVLQVVEESGDPTSVVDRTTIERLNATIRQPLPCCEKEDAQVD